MSPDSVKILKSLIIKHEGIKLRPYKDTTGHLTIGIGRNLTDSGLYPNEPIMMLENDIEYFTSELSEKIAYFGQLDEARKIVLIDMCFNLGIKGLLSFKNMLNAIKNRNWQKASDEILNSLASKQAPSRYSELANIMKTGIFNA